MNFRTDIALERRGLLGTEKINGVESETRNYENARVNEIKVVSKEGERAIGKPMGRYITVEVPSFSYDSQLLDGRLTALIEEIRNVLPKDGCVLTAGLGNDEITADALGPMCASMIFATRHISEELKKDMGMPFLRSVCAVTPGVLGKTGIETSEIIKGLTEKVKPSAVIAVDALAAMKLSRLASTVQISTTGISPGSGVGNRRSEISEKTIGVPVISIGIPTVISAKSIADELSGKESDSEIYDMIVCPRESDMISQRGAKLIALAINCALQPSIRAQEMLTLM